MIKVLHIAPTPFFSDRGCHIRIKGIIKGLERYQIENIVATYHHGREVEGIRTIRTLSIPGYTKLDAGPTPFKYLADILLFINVIIILARERPSIIHGHLHEGVLIGWAANICFFWRRTPLVFDMQGSLVGELEAHGYFNQLKFLKKLFWAVEYLVTRMPNLILCSSKASVRVLVEKFGVPSNRVFLAGDGADVVEVDKEQAFGIKKSLDIDQDRPTVIYTGALSEAKGMGVLTDLICLAQERELNCQFLVIGYPVEIFNEFISEKNVSNICRLVGRVPFEELATYLSCADIAIEPKKADSAEASGKLLNYMGAGLPVLCFKTSNNYDFLGESGFFSNDESATSLLHKLSEILDNLEEAKAIGLQSKIKMLERFSWDHTARIVFENYQNILKPKNSVMPINNHKEDT